MIRLSHLARLASYVSVTAILIENSERATAQPATFASTAQHTAQYSPPAQHLNRVVWSTPIDLNNAGAYAHYGAPLITPANTVLVSVKITNGFKVNAFEGPTGRQKYTVFTDYIMPTHNWIPSYQPVLSSPPTGTRLYYAGAGGTVYHIDNPDSDSPGAPVQECFYTNMTAYTAGSNGFNNTIFINTPLTADTNGVIFFGFRVQQMAPAPLNTTNSGFGRLDPSGTAIYVLAGPAASDNRIVRDTHNSAPALSNDGSTLYVAVKGTNSAYAYLLGLDSTTLATKYRVQLRDPRNNNFAIVSDDGTASATVAPDGDVFFGVLGNPNTGLRGFLLRFSADLATQKMPSGFGWDYTPAIVPSSMLPGYTGTSSYLLFSKYNNYAVDDGNGINRVALLDPNAAQLDAHPSASGLMEMREVLTIIGPTPDSENYSASLPYAVREWCINTAAVNPATKSIFAPSEDGHIYRWDLASNSVSEVFTLGPGVGAPYVPTVVGPDGIVYALNGGTMFALGGYTNLSVTVVSSVPDLRTLITGQPVTFTAIVTNLDGSDPQPTGTVTFEDLTYNGLAATNIILGTAVPLVNGLASVTTSDLMAGSNFLGNHYITAVYSGDSTFETGRAMLVQKVHAGPTTTALKSSVPPPGSSNVTLTATVTSSLSGAGKPTGQVSFWDGSIFLGQTPLNSSGIATFTTSALTNGNHAINATYVSDTVFASSTGNLIGSPTNVTAILLSDGSLQLNFTNGNGAPFTVLGTTDLSVPLSNWAELGPAIEIMPGEFQFTDAQATSHIARFYRVRSP